MPAPPVTVRSLVTSRPNPSSAKRTQAPSTAKLSNASESKPKTQPEIFDSVGVTKRLSGNQSVPMSPRVAWDERQPASEPGLTTKATSGTAVCAAVS